MIGVARRHGGHALGVGAQVVLAAAAIVSFAWLRARGAAREAPAPGTWPRELAPLVAGLVACGPIAAGGAAELARMRLDAQVDALRAMGGSVWRHLVAPRLLAGLLAVPLLVAIADAAGLAVASLPLGSAGAMAPGPAGSDVLVGLARGALAGALLASLACGVGLLPAGAIRLAPAGHAAKLPPARAAAWAGALGVAGVLGLQLLLGGAGPW